MLIGRRMMMVMYLDPAPRDALRKLSEVTRIPVAVYVREAIDDLLKKYARDLRPRRKLPIRVKRRLPLKRRKAKRG